MHAPFFRSCSMDSVRPTGGLFGGARGRVSRRGRGSPLTCRDAQNLR